MNWLKDLGTTMTKPPLVFKHHKGETVAIVGLFTHADTGKVHYAIAREDNPDSIVVESHARFWEKVTKGPTAPCQRYTPVKPRR